MNDRKVFTDSVTELPTQPGLTKHGLMVNEAKSEDRNERMDVLFSLEMPSKDDLEKRVAAGEVIAVEQLNQKYAPKRTNVDALKSWLAEQGFKVTGERPDGSSVYTNVKMVRVTKNEITYPAAQNVPSLPMSIGAPVQAIIGLQPFRHTQKHRARTFIRHNRSTLDRNGVVVPNEANSPLISFLRY